MPESCCEQQHLAEAAVGIPNVASLRKSALQAECLKRGLSQQGTKDELRQRLQSFLARQDQRNTLAFPARQEGEFDWVICQSGFLHWEMKIVQSVVDVLWAFVYEAFSKSQGYTTPRQLQWCKSCKDHHRAFDELSRFTDGVFDELLRPYVSEAADPSPAGFFTWCQNYKNNLTYTWLLHVAVQYCFPLFMFLRGMRHNYMP